MTFLEIMFTMLVIVPYGSVVVADWAIPSAGDLRKARALRTGMES